MNIEIPIKEIFWSNSPFFSIKPWEEPVDGEMLLADIETYFFRFLVLPQGAAQAAALWVLYTHCSHVFDAPLNVIISSSVPRCGKSLFICILSALVPRPLHLYSLATSLEQHCPTLFIDDAHEHHMPFSLHVQIPKAIAFIGSPHLINENGLQIRMKRGKPLEEFQFRHREGLVPLARKAARWASDNTLSLLVGKVQVPAVLSDEQARKNWSVLLAIADTVGGHRPELARIAVAHFAKS